MTVRDISPKAEFHILAMQFAKTEAASYMCSLSFPVHYLPALVGIPRYQPKGLQPLSTISTVFFVYSSRSSFGRSSNSFDKPLVDS